jgi:hypothetical protein
MYHRKDAKQTAYCRRQALACANAAMSTAIAEVKEAYLNLEQGWLCLAPKIGANPDGFPNPAVGQKVIQCQAKRQL